MPRCPIWGSGSQILSPVKATFTPTPEMLLSLCCCLLGSRLASDFFLSYRASQGYTSGWKAQASPLRFPHTDLDSWFLLVPAQDIHAETGTLHGISKTTSCPLALLSRLQRRHFYPLPWEGWGQQTNQRLYPILCQNPDS